MDKIEIFLSKKKRFYKILQDINSTSVDSLDQLKKELKLIEKQLSEIESLQNRYLEAFEKSTLPIAVLQERLQKVSIEKERLEQRKDEISIQLSTTDSKGDTI